MLGFGAKDKNSMWTLLVAKLVVIIIFFILTVQLATQAQPWTILDYLNLPLHAFGHILFSLFGQVISLLGGTIVQLLVPLALLLYFLVRKLYFAAGVGLFWLGDNLIITGVYMQDARAQTIHLLGEKIHDWNFLFLHMGILPDDLLIGEFFSALGILFLFSALIIMIAVLSARIQHTIHMLATAETSTA
jgi:hypothetical protein